MAVDDVIVGGAGWSHISGTISTVTDNLGNSYVVHSDQIDSGEFDAKARTFRSKVTVAGTPTLTVTFTDTSSFRRVLAGAWAGSAAAPLDTSVGNLQEPAGTGTDAVTSTNITTSQNNELLVGFHTNFTESDPGTGSISAGTSYTMRQTHNAILAMEERILATAGSVAATFTISNGHNTATHLVAIKPAGATSPPMFRGS